VRTYLEDFDGSVINRIHVIKAYRDFFSNSNINPVHPFLLSMTWGYYNANHGAFRANRLVARDNRRLIRESLQAMKNGKQAAAFKALNSIPYMGMSYISKALYFAGRALRMRRYLLILDNRVAEALVAAYSNNALNSVVSVSRAKTYNALKSYSDLLHSWADDLDVPAENLEYFLFLKNF
jgi:hypothetical protein